MKERSRFDIKASSNEWKWCEKYVVDYTLQAFVLENWRDALHEFSKTSSEHCRCLPSWTTVSFPTFRSISFYNLNVPVCLYVNMCTVCMHMCVYSHVMCTSACMSVEAWSDIRCLPLLFYISFIGAVYLTWSLRWPVAHSLAVFLLQEPETLLSKGWD